MEKISEKELVFRFGTEKQKEKYEIEGTLRGDNKKGVIRRASKYCTVANMGDGTYKLTNQKKVAVTPEFLKASEGVYQYTCPLILEHILNDKRDKVIIGTVSLAENIELISEHFTPLRKDPRMTAEDFSLDLRSVYDYMQRLTNSLNYYIQQSLNYLQKMQLVVQKTNYVFRLGKSEIAGFNAFDVDVKTCLATDELMKIYTDALAIADKVAGTKSESERYYSEKSKEWYAVYYEELKRHGIMGVWRVHELYVVNSDKCKEYREKFDSSEKLVIGLAKEFRKTLYNKALKNTDAEVDSDDLLFTYNFLSRICIGNRTLSQNIEEKILHIKEENEKKKYVFTITEGE